MLSVFPIIADLQIEAGLVGNRGAGVSAVLRTEGVRRQDSGLQQPSTLVGSLEAFARVDSRGAGLSALSSMDRRSPKPPVSDHQRQADHQQIGGATWT